MEKTKQSLKWTSYLVLFFAAWTLVQLVVALFCGNLDFSLLSTEATEGMILTAKIIIVAISTLLLLPQVFVGCRGLQLVKNPATKTKAALVWAVILLVISAWGLVDPIVGIIKQTNVTDNVFLAFSNLAEALLFFDFIRLTKILTKDVQ
ncbi:MAG: hypothetical protein IKU55_00295 [Clostridia bacterium]|nr:hypothetical protein [Clostridia bacterium]